jgi:hypothetical protein
VKCERRVRDAEFRGEEIFGGQLGILTMSVMAGRRAGTQGESLAGGVVVLAVGGFGAFTMDTGRVAKVRDGSPPSRCVNDLTPPPQNCH